MDDQDKTVQWRMSCQPTRVMRASTAVCGAALLVAFALLLLGCSGSSSSTHGVSAATPIPGVTVVVGQNSATPTLDVVGGQGAQEGIADICSQPSQVNAAVPDSIPSYPGAKLRLSDLSNGNGDFGYCATAATADVAAFYAKQLPDKGWQNVTSYTFSSGKQVTATQGNAFLIVTMQPDVHTGGEADILITVNGL